VSAAGTKLEAPQAPRGATGAEGVGAGGGYIKMACSGALWSMDFKLNHVPACKRRRLTA